MDPLRDWNALQDLTSAVPRGAAGYSTNLYGGREQVERWCAADRLRVLVADGAVLVLRADRDFRHVYHVARDLSALTAALRLLPAGLYTTDLVGRGDVLDRVCEAHAAAGFAHHAFLRRMGRGQATEPLLVEASDEDGVVTATAEDADAVAAFLDRLLDRFTEQLPEHDELREAAEGGRLLLVRRGSDLAGMLMYDVQGQLAHLRFWHVDPAVQGAGVGRRLMASFLSRCAGARRIVLWVVGNNDRSIAIYRHYGFETDGLLDRVMTRNKDQHR